jgi:hypothetical protein
MHIDVTRVGPQAVEVHFHGRAGNPLVLGAPEISWDFRLKIDTSTGSSVWTMTDSALSGFGGHDGFPAHEIYINNHPIHTYHPGGTSPYTISQLASLGPPVEISVNSSGVLP